MNLVDAHHHLWDPARRAYPWLAADALAPIRCPYTMTDLRRHIRESGVDATVLVQTVSELAETEEFLAVAARDGPVAGVVGWVDLTAPDVAETLARLRRAGPLVGIRHQVQDEPDPDWLLRSDVLRGLRAVSQAGLAYDLLVKPPQLPAARRAAEQLPELRFVLDHAAKPAIADGRWQPWAGELAALAELPHVSCKLSGLVTEASWLSWHADQIRRYADHVLDRFGPARVMFGSDWPVCELAASYQQVVRLARQLTAGLSDTERAHVFSGTARRSYALPLRGGDRDQHSA